jgi:triphosphatase
MEKNLEIELKLHLDKSSLKAFLSAPLLTKKVVKGSSKTLPLLSTYYDTADFALEQAGIAYRVRRTGKEYEATIKSDKMAASGLSQRREITVPLVDSKPILTGFENTDLPALTKHVPLEKLFTVKVERQVKLLRLNKDTLVELAVDQGVVKGAKKTAKIDEIELELKEGSLGPLLKYAAQIAAKYPLFVELRSKFERGMDLLGKTLPPRESGKKIRFSLHKPYTEEFPGECWFFANKILQKQNILLQKGISKGDAEDLQENFLYIKALVLWLLPLLPKSRELCAGIDKLLEPLEALIVLEDLQEQSARVYKLMGTSLKTVGLKPMLVEAQTKAKTKILEQIKKGLYTRILFRLLAQLHSSLWRENRYLQTDKLLQCRGQELVKGLKVLCENKKDKEERTLTYKRQLLFTDACTKMLTLARIGGWNKETAKRFPKVNQALRETLVLSEQLNLIGKMTGKKASLAYGKGILEGWCLKKLQNKQTKAKKELTKLLTSL